MKGFALDLGDERGASSFAGPKEAGRSLTSNEAARPSSNLKAMKPPMHAIQLSPKQGSRPKVMTIVRAILPPEVRT